MRMRSEIPLTPEQLEAVFDSLDVKGNGYLTIEQFLEGFGKFLKSHTSSNGTKSRSAPAEDIYSADEDSEVSLHTPDEEEEDHFNYLLEQLHSTNILHNVDILRGLCQRVQREASPQMQANLEKFLQQLASDLKRRQHEQWALEEALRARDEDHNKHVQKLFEEMEAQLTEDKENLLRQEEQRLRLSQKTLEDELLHKDEFLKDVLTQQKEMSEQLQAFRLRETNARQENIKLIRRKEELELKLDGQYQEIYNLQRNLDETQTNETLERRKNLAAGFRMAQSIMLEQRGLLQQLQLVKNMATTIKESQSESMDKKLENKTWQSAPDKSRKSEDSAPYFQTSVSLDTTNGFLDDYEYDEDYSQTSFQRPEVLKSSLETQSSSSSYTDKFDSVIPCLQDELAFSQKTTNSCDYSGGKKGETHTSKLF